MNLQNCIIKVNLSQEEHLVASFYFAIPKDKTYVYKSAFWLTHLQMLLVGIVVIDDT